MNSNSSRLVGKNSRPIFFMLKLVLVFLLLENFYSYLLSPYTSIDHSIIQNIKRSTEWLLSFLNYEVLPDSSLFPYRVGVNDTSGVVIGEPCNGLSLFVLYISFLIVFKGKWWGKLLFILLGTILIHLLNILRVTALALVVKYAPENLEFHHSYTFTLIIYLFIMLLWMIRINVYKHQKC